MGGGILMQAVIELKAMGYEFAVSNGLIKYRYAGGCKQDAVRAEILLQQLKANKPAAIAYLQAMADRRIAKEDHAAAMVDAIRDQAIAAGWTADQLDDLRRTLARIPAERLEIGLVRREGISISLFWYDGTYRGSLTFYNMEIEQTWLKHQK